MQSAVSRTSQRANRFEPIDSEKATSLVFMTDSCTEEVVTRGVFLYKIEITLKCLVVVFQRNSYVKWLNPCYF